jgi:hypothetical protein
MERSIDFPIKEGTHPEIILLIKRMLDVRKENRIRWAEILTRIYSSFVFVIYKME